MAESPDDLLFVQLIRLQLHAPHGLHGAVVLQTLFTSHHHLSGRGVVQLVDITLLQRGINPKYPQTLSVSSL